MLGNDRGGWQRLGGPVAPNPVHQEDFGLRPEVRIVLVVLDDLVEIVQEVAVGAVGGPKQTVHRVFLNRKLGC